MKNNSITLDSAIRRSNKKLITNTLGDELVMMDMESGDYLGINEIGTAIWAKIESAIYVKALVVELLKEYDVEQELCERQTIKYLQEMEQQGLIIVDNKS